MTAEGGRIVMKPFNSLELGIPQAIAFDKLIRVVVRIQLVILNNKLVKDYRD